ncbi:HAMP domain-containing sensor histidine kinase [Acinetobacter sp. MD2(2019)]|uniref:sensor histidine kinase n=1 Tax=Acinetobacter sp. MD2(2019) TaxID=2605273 RepID=UPI002D1F50E9|nr:HAMP domain-containing sensor histidine kinase [Acinetobacter sp. MD2(2019)]MEB3754282.1 HAMP domain-containing histidine kinase [Acinetobacter sp. MD2(2019)]
MERLQRLTFSQTERLSECRFSLALGVKGPRNQIGNCLKFARKILAVKQCIWRFFHEPYAWFADKNQFEPCVIPMIAQADFLFSCDAFTYADATHPDYPLFSSALTQLGCDHQRVAVFYLIVNEQKIGQVIFFDEIETPFAQEDLDLVAELLTSMLLYAELKFDFQELKETYEELSALNFSRTKFFQVIAHDLRAPFHGLLGFSEVLAEEHDTLSSTEVEHMAGYLNDTAKSTYQLLENLLNWAMAEGGRFVYHPINFKLKQVTQIVKNVLTSLAKQKNIELIEDVDDDIYVYADMNMLTSILQNLTSNALKFTTVDGSGKVSISARLDAGFVAISIVDTGLGMTQAQLEQVFEPRLKLSLKGTAGEKGTGLGLVLCKRFVDLNQGEISVHSKEGQGTTFVVKIPLAHDTHVHLKSTVAEKKCIDC